MRLKGRKKGLRGIDPQPPRSQAIESAQAPENAGFVSFTDDVFE